MNLTIKNSSQMSNETANPNNLINRTSNYSIRKDDSLLKTFDSLLLNGRLSDITFTVEGKHIAAHSLLLAARSSVFEAMLYGPGNTDTRSITITDCKYDIFNTMLIYVYTDAVEIHQNNAVPVMMIARKYDLNFLEAKCETYLLNCDDLEETIIHFDNLFVIDAFATLKQRLVQRIKKDIEKQYCHNLFVHISNFEALKHLVEAIVTIKSENYSNLLLKLFEMLIEWAKEQTNKNGISANIRQSLGGLEQMIDVLKFNEADFAACLEICPNFFNADEMMKIDENLSKLRARETFGY